MYTADVKYVSKQKAGLNGHLVSGDVHSPSTSIHHNKSITLSKGDWMHLMLDAGHCCCFRLVQQNQASAANQNPIAD